MIGETAACDGGGGEAVGWGRGEVLVAFVFPALWRGHAVLWGQQWSMWAVDSLATRLEAWASVGGLVFAALGVWLDARAQPPDAAFNRVVVVVLLALLLGWCTVGVAFLGFGT